MEKIKPRIIKPRIIKPRIIKPKRIKPRINLKQLFPNSTGRTISHENYYRDPKIQLLEI
jgi:hypothetical protein